MSRIRALLIAATVLLASSMAFATSASEIRERIEKATSSFRDITVTCRVTYANHDALRKIGKDFQRSYEIKTTTVQYKAPDKFKVSGKLGWVSGYILINDDWKVTHFVTNRKENISKEPHKRQSDFDMGVISGSIWRNYIVTDAEVERNGDEASYKITMVRSNARDKKIICWVDADQMKVMKVEKYEDDGSLKSRVLFSKHKKVEDVWVPTKVDVYNCSGQHCATSIYDSIKVNTGIPDSVFKI